MVKGVVFGIVRIVISPLHFVVLFAEHITKVFFVWASLSFLLYDAWVMALAEYKEHTAHTKETHEETNEKYYDA